jgi:8-amino-7-oxononanoate synthase
MNPVEKYLQKKLSDREAAGNLRKLSTKSATIDLYSNDYLGFVRTGLLQERMQEKGAPYAAGSTGSRLLSGNSKEAEMLEQKIAQFHNAEAALLFNSGYDANLGLIASITSRHTTILYDELCHASIIDGIRLSHVAKKYKFGHNNIEELNEQLEKAKSDEQIIVVVESVYSMDGDEAPLKAITELTNQYNAVLIVDEAHSTGVIGRHGEGLVCNSGLEDIVFARVHTFGKALGCHGAAIVGSVLLKQYLVNFARSFIYTTALPMHAIKAIDCAYDELLSEQFSNEGLHELIRYFNCRKEEPGIQGWKVSKSAIHALVVGSVENTKVLAQKLQEAGLQINPILSPTVAAGEERLRICLHSFNTKEQIDRLMEIILKHT